MANAVTQAANDKQQLAPMIDKLKALPKELGRVKRLLADSGYLSEANVEHCAAAKIEPLIAMKRERHNASWKERFAEDPKAPPASANARAHGASAEDAGGAKSSTPCASKPPSRSSASSNR